MNQKLRSSIAALVAAGFIAPVAAEPATYTIDPTHTWSAFEADHSGLSVWRGKIKAQSGSIVLDRAAKTGTIEVTMDMSTTSTGNGALDTHIKGAEGGFDVAKFPTAVYKGTFTKFDGDLPTEAKGDLTLHGVTRPVELKILKFTCKQNAMLKREACGADATATFERDAFGVIVGKGVHGMSTLLRIDVEAIGG
jgi:polyisoprenoid-binding protein YceI